MGALILLSTYAHHGPVGHNPIVWVVPDSILFVVCPGTWGCYHHALPDLIMLSQTGSEHPATLPHEMLHYSYPNWSECEVSDYLFTTTGLSDGYKVNGDC